MRISGLSLLSGLIGLSLMSGCATTRQQSSVQSTTQRRLYWKVYPKSDNTFYILPRPELTADLSTPGKMNALAKDQAMAIADSLNTSLQFKAQVNTEAGVRVVRIAPEPLIEDVVEVCREKAVHPFLEPRCQKERGWAERGQRPDIYLPFDTCEAVVLANALNKLYGRNAIATELCPELRQVEK